MNRPSTIPPLTSIGAAVALVTVAPALAHPMHGAGLAGGFAHPLLGLDHLLAMVAVGLWAAQLGGRWLWAVPLSFLVAMLAGALPGFSNARAPMLDTAVEPMIAASVLILGLLVAFRRRLNARGRAAGAALVAGFALFHGYAHAAALPADATVMAYAAGFFLATAALHGTGVAAGRLLRAGALRAAGVPIALAGGWLVFGAVLGTN